MPSARRGTRHSHRFNGLEALRAPHPALEPERRDETHDAERIPGGYAAWESARRAARAAPARSKSPAAKGAGRGGANGTRAKQAPAKGSTAPAPTYNARSPGRPVSAAATRPAKHCSPRPSPKTLPRTAGSGAKSAIATIKEGNEKMITGIHAVEPSAGHDHHLGSADDAEGLDIHLMRRKRALLRVREVVQILGIGRSTVYELMDSGTLESVRIGKSRRIPTEALEQFLADLRGRRAAQDCA